MADSMVASMVGWKVEKMVDQLDVKWVAKMAAMMVALMDFLKAVWKVA